MDQLAQNRKNDLTDEEKWRAAYALNLCMVSVSQIIDYDDVYILEQEYDAILNNLDLEQMPKDEALLDILKQLLNVITFFRIQEKEKVFIERKYQQRMKDAIWSAVPNLSVIVAGGDLPTMAVSLIAQVGIGYMNYRRERSKIRLEEEQTRWKLQRAAMEQFNGLRRELFDTAWRLADAYRFPDAYRITERQIGRYNKILMDRDPLRRYERLGTIADRFEAYPPFLYFWGNAANMVYQDERYDPETRSYYKALACEHFQQFLARTERGLLREDHLLASCALEYFELLAVPSGSGAPADRAYLESLLSRAAAVSGSTFDVLQICSMSYLKIGCTQKASTLLRLLVNEDYNAAVNAQLLSSLYVARYLQSGDEQARRDYSTLRTRIAPELLFPFPDQSTAEDGRALEARFIRLQQKLLARRYSAVLTNLLERYTIAFNRIVPVADTDQVYPDRYFENPGEARKQDILELFEDPRARSGYVLRLSQAHIETQIVSLLNDVYSTVCGLPCMGDRASRKRFYALVQEQTQAQQPRFDVLLSKLYSGTADAFGQDDCRYLLSFSLASFTGKAFDSLYDVIVGSIRALGSMAEISCAGSQLYGFCIDHDIPYPTIHFPSENASTALETCAPLPFDERLLGRKAFQLKQELEQAQHMAECVRSYQEALLPNGKSPFKLYLRGDDKLIDHIEKDRALREFGQDRIIAVIDDTSLGDQDIILTTAGVCPYYRTLFMKIFADPVPYDSVKLVRSPVLTLKIGEFDLMDKKLDIVKLYELMMELASIEKAGAKAALRLPRHKEG